VEGTTGRCDDDAHQDSAGDLTSLVLQAQQGDEPAFRSLYRSLNPALLRYAAVIVGQDAEDVVAESWLQIARDLLRFEGDGPAFRRFAVTVTRNRARDLLRRKGSRVQEISLPTAELPEPRTAPKGSAMDAAEIVGAKLSAREAVALVATLPKLQAEAVMLRVVLDMDTKSAAEILGKRPSAVAMALSRGLKRLVRTMEQRETAVRR
jgi:RNA polymerase sigma-70 factor (ECF subfamily)